jgi:hypothetical protein
MADAHRLIVKKVVLQAVSNLLRAPGRCPTSLLARSMSATFPEHRRSENRSTTWSNDYASQPILHICPQHCVQRQLCRLRATSGPFSMPLRRGGPIIQGAAARPRAPRLRSIGHQQSKSKTGAGAPAARPGVGPENVACSATHDPTGDDLLSQHSSPGCCDDQLNQPAGGRRGRVPGRGVGGH